MDSKLLVLGVSSLAAAVSAALSAPALAQSPGARGIDEITVTARKREETVLEVPIALSAFDAEAIQDAAMFNVMDISRMTPGLSFTEAGNIWPGRLYSQIFFRGMTVINPQPKDQVGAIFIDGVYFLSAASSINTFDIGRVEVLKGPQNAYFGRNTFGGAINFVTKTPEGPQRTSVETDFTARGSHKASIANEGTLIEDQLLYRVSASKYRRAPQYFAADGGALGEQSSTNLSLTLYATPTPRLQARARFQYGEDKDGPTNSAYLWGVTNDTCGGNVPSSRFDENGNPVTVFPRNFICGQVPTISQLGSSVVSQNTTLSSIGFANRGLPNILRDVIQDKSFEQYVAPGADPRIVGITRGLLDKVPSLDGFGMRRQFLLTSLSADYELTDSLTLSGVLGYNKSETYDARDIDAQDQEIQYQVNANITKDTSAEIRLSWDNGGRLSAMGGVNYYKQEYDGSFTGILSFRPVTGVPMGVNGNGNGAEADVVGWFGAVNYEITPELRATLEGRYQRDKITDTGNRLVPESISFTDFMPRAILSWLPGGGNTNIYGSYSKGVIPGIFNNSLTDPSIPAAERERLARESGATLILDSETLDAYELGWKQRFADGRGYVNMAAYYMEWKGQKLLASLPVTLVDGSVASRSFQLPADLEIWGVEIDAGWVATDWLSLDATINWTDSEYKSGLDNNVGILTRDPDVLPAGTRNMRGLTVTRFPEWSGSVAATFSGDLNAEWGWYSRLDVLYTGKQFTDPANLSYIKAYTVAHARAGLRSDNKRVELYIRNLTDDRNWINGARLVQLTDFQTVGLMLTPQDRQEVGIRFSMDF